MIYQHKPTLEQDFFSFQPGDGTRYEFVLFRETNPFTDTNFWWCAGSLNRLVYILPDEVKEMVENYGPPPDERDAYHAWGDKAIHSSPVSCVQVRDSTGKMNPWTALAIIAAIWRKEHS